MVICIQRFLVTTHRGWFDRSQGHSWTGSRPAIQGLHYHQSDLSDFHKSVKNNIWGQQSPHSYLYSDVSDDSFWRGPRHQTTPLSPTPLRGGGIMSPTVPLVTKGAVGDIIPPTSQRCGGEWGQNISSTYYTHVTKKVYFTRLLNELMYGFVRGIILGDRARTSDFFPQICIHME